MMTFEYSTKKIRNWMKESRLELTPSKINPERANKRYTFQNRSRLDKIRKIDIVLFHLRFKIMKVMLDIVV